MRDDLRRVKCAVWVDIDETVFGRPGCTARAQAFNAMLKRRMKRIC